MCMHAAVCWKILCMLSPFLTGRMFVRRTYFGQFDELWFVRLVSRRASVRICFGSPFSSKVVVWGHRVETFKWNIKMAVSELYSKDKTPNPPPWPQKSCYITYNGIFKVVLHLCAWSARRSSLKGRERAIVSQTNIGTVPKATLGKLGFSVCINTILNWTVCMRARARACVRVCVWWSDNVVGLCLLSSTQVFKLSTKKLQSPDFKYFCFIFKFPWLHLKHKYSIAHTNSTSPIQEQRNQILIPAVYCQ